MRDIQALGLVYSGEDPGNAELKEKIKTSKSGLEELCRMLNEFLAQEAKSPILLIPKSSASGEMS